MNNWKINTVMLNIDTVSWNETLRYFSVLIFSYTTAHSDRATSTIQFSYKYSHGHGRPLLSTPTHRFQPLVERNSKLHGSRPGTGAGSFRGGGLRQGVQEWLHRTVHASIHVHPNRCDAGTCRTSRTRVRTWGQLSLILSNLLPPGYRHIHLLSKDGTATPPSSIFVNVSISERTWRWRRRWRERLRSGDNEENHRRPRDLSALKSACTFTLTAVSLTLLPYFPLLHVYIILLQIYCTSRKKQKKQIKSDYFSDVKILYRISNK